MYKFGCHIDFTIFSFSYAVLNIAIKMSFIFFTNMRNMKRYTIRVEIKKYSYLVAKYISEIYYIPIQFSRICCVAKLYIQAYFMHEYIMNLPTYST